MINEFKQLHMVSIVSEFLKMLRRFIVPIIISYLIGHSTEDSLISGPYKNTFVFICLFVSLIYGIYRWTTFKYKFHMKEIQIQKGLFVKKNIYISKDKIKSINISKALIPRIFGLVQLTIKSEGTEDNDPTIKLVALSKKEALEIQNTFFNYSTSPTFNNEVSRNRRLSKSTLLLSAITSNSLFPTLVAILAFYYQFDIELNKAIGIPKFNSIDKTPIVLIILWAFLILMSAWVLSIIRTIIRFGNFSIFVNEQTIHIQKGLSEKKEIMIDIKDLRAIKIEENILKQLFGLSCIYIESSGGDNTKRNVSTVLHPLIKKEEVEAFLKALSLPYPSLTKFNPLPKQAMWRYITRKVFFSLIISLLAVYFLKINFQFTIPVIILFALYGLLQYREAGYGFSKDFFLLIKRSIRRNTIVFVKEHIESISFKQSYMQKKKGLENISLTILSNISKKKFKLGDIRKRHELDIYLWFKKEKN